MSSVKLIFGLANPGEEYFLTRHNAGAWYVEEIAETSFKFESKLKSQITKLMSPTPCILAVPTTYMNLSGQALQAVMQYYKINIDEILVAHDDIDLPVGEIKIKEQGGHGGHNGLRDIFKQLGTKKFWRLRIGVGRPANKNQVADYVLKKPSANERQAIDDCIMQAINVTPDIIAGNFQHAMQQLHSE